MVPADSNPDLRPVNKKSLAFARLSVLTLDIGLSFGLLLLHADNFAPFVIPAIRANGMRQAFFAAVGAAGRVAGLQGVVRPAAVAAALGMLALRKRSHGSNNLCSVCHRLNYIQQNTCFGQAVGLYLVGMRGSRQGKLCFPQLRGGRRRTKQSPRG